MIKQLLPIAIASALSCSSYATSTISYTNNTAQDAQLLTSMTVDGTSIAAGTTLINKNITGDTATITVGDKTFAIKDLHTPCLRYGVFQIAVGWEMELSTDDSQSIGQICAEANEGVGLVSFFSSFTVSPSYRNDKHYSVTYKNTGDYASYTASATLTNSITYSW